MDLMKRSSYFYELPHELIAQTPPQKRDASRLLCLDRKSGFIEILSQEIWALCDALSECRVNAIGVPLVNFVSSSSQNR